MLAIEHLGTAAALAFAFTVAGLALNRLKVFEITYKDCVFVFLALVVSQGVDFDHYGGSLAMMYHCVLLASVHSGYLQLCQETLQRGALHNIDVFHAGASLLIIWGGVAFIEKHRTTALLCFALAVGWAVHLYCDTLILQQLNPFVNL
jgi:hypothetical protein